MPTTATALSELGTPTLVLDADRMARNIARMQGALGRHGVRLRTHVKTCKSVPVALAVAGGSPGPITVSTLREAEQFAAAGFDDVLYAVGIAPQKLDAVAALRARGVDLTVVVDGVEAARAVAARGAGIPVLIEIDSDDHRAGVRPDAPELLAIAAALQPGARLRGVMTHAGAAYECRGAAAIAAMAARERDAVVAAASRLRAGRFPVDVVSVGSTPTATFAERLDGVTEARVGVFVFQDLVMAGLGVCALDDIALSVLVTVIGHQPRRRQLVTDGGWMALSRDRGTARHAVDRGYGVVCDLHGAPIDDLIVVDTNQEHGLVARAGGGTLACERFPVGTLLRVLPNHACATAAQHDAYHVVHGGVVAAGRWPRFSGW